MAQDVSMYWDIRRTLTHNSLINVIVGNRGGGKTYGSKKWCIDNFIKSGEQFAYVRRYRDELKDSLSTFFNDIMTAYPDYEFKTDSKHLYIREKPKNEKQKWLPEDIAGYGFVLSTASNKKSVAYPNVTTIVFDEFLLDNGHVRYITDEPVKLLNLYETIARPGTDHKRVTMFMLANALSVTNPYFLFWNLKMPTRKDKNGKYIWKHPDKPILVEDVRNEKFIEAKQSTEFGELVRGTRYAQYSINNEFLLDDDTFVERKSKNSRYFCTLIYKDYTFGVWVDYSQGKMWVSEDNDPSYRIIYTLTIKDHKPNTMFFRTKNIKGHFKLFIENYKLGNVYFESMKVKNLSYEMFRLCLSM